jgi:hypothetical protein
MWRAGPERAGRLALVVLTALAACLAPGATPSAAGQDPIWLADASALPPATANQLDTLVKDLDLSLLRGPLGDSLVVPLGGTRLVRPYAAIGGGLGLARVNDPLDPYRNMSRRGESTDLAAGFSWKLSDRFQLFGEYRFLSISPEPGSGALDDQLQGGLSIRF